MDPLCCVAINLLEEKHLISSSRGALIMKQYVTLYHYCLYIQYWYWLTFVTVIFKLNKPQIKEEIV